MTEPTDRRSTETDDEHEMCRAIGRRLREVRRATGMTLEEVTAASGQVIKMSTLGSYERGDRALTVARLCTLAGLYGVPVTELLPEQAPTPSEAVIDLRDHAQPAAAELARQASDVLDPDTRAGLVREFARATVADRARGGGRDYLIRRDDVERIARLLGIDRREVRRQLRRSESLPR